MSTALSALAEIGQVLAVQRCRLGLHKQLLGIIRDAVGCDAAALTRVNPFSHEHETLCNIGYSPVVLHHLNNWFVTHDEVYRYMRKYDSRPLRWKDMPFPYETMYSAVRVFRPAGYQEGVTVCLFNEAGNYTGSLHISSSAYNRPSDEAMRLLSAAQPIAGTVADWWHDLDTDPDVEEPTRRLRVAITQYGDYRLLRSHNDELRILVESFVLPALPPMQANFPKRSFLVQGRTSLAIQAHYLSDTLLLDIQYKPIPLGLTARELDVSTLLLRGLTNGAIAGRLGISVKTASHHVENIIHKLDCSSRTEATVKADRLDLRSLALDVESARNRLSTFNGLKA